MAQHQLQRLNHRHRAIINWLICNPHKSAGECGRQFGYTQCWMSQIINSDMFQAAYQLACEAAGAAPAHMIKAKVAAAASMGLDRTMQLLDTGAATERFVLDSTRNNLGAIGMGQAEPSAGKEGDKHLHLHITGDMIAEAREKARLIRRIGCDEAGTKAVVPEG